MKLANPKHELFCHLVARGHEVDFAYWVAGYPRDLEAAKVLLQQKTVIDRINHLAPLYHEKYGNPLVTVAPFKPRFQYAQT
jgi:hypothetical protein